MDQNCEQSGGYRRVPAVVAAMPGDGLLWQVVTPPGVVLSPSIGAFLSVVIPSSCPRASQRGLCAYVANRALLYLTNSLKRVGYHLRHDEIAYGRNDRSHPATRAAKRA